MPKNAYEQIIEELQTELRRERQRNSELESELASVNKLGSPVWPEESGKRQVITLEGATK